MILLRYSKLGSTGLSVSALCFGSLPIGPAQYSLSPDDGKSIVDFAWSMGVNFFDTSEFYSTYPYLKAIARRPGAVISTRSYAYNEEGMRCSLDLARKELGRDVIDIFGLHEQESGLTLKGHRGALEYLCRAKEKGDIRAISVSTHYTNCVRSAAMHDEVDVILAILNMAGLGIRGGNLQDMENALAFAKSMGKGIYIMKVIGGGHLYRDPGKALRYARDFPHKDSVCVGMKNRYEVEFAAKVIAGEDFPETTEKVSAAGKRLSVEDWCQGCGRCQEVCGFSAIHVIGGKAVVDPEKCMLCGYCAKACPHFCLKVI